MGSEISLGSPRCQSVAATSYAPALSTRLNLWFPPSLIIQCIHDGNISYAFAIQRVSKGKTMVFFPLPCLSAFSCLCNKYTIYFDNALWASDIQISIISGVFFCLFWVAEYSPSLEGDGFWKLLSASVVSTEATSTAWSSCGAKA